MPIRRTSSGSSQDTGFYNPEIFSDVGSRLVFPTDPDAAAYIAAVESADGQELEFPVKVAYNDFVLGCKSDGIWNAIKASCIMAGARTLAGALTPLVGTAPTNNNFVAGDYNRTTGLVGDGSTKYLNSNRNNNADPQNSFHVSAYMSYVGTTGYALGCGSAEPGYFLMGTTLTAPAQANRSNSDYNLTSAPIAGLIAHSRSNSSTFFIRHSSLNIEVSRTSQSPANLSILVYCRGTPASPAIYSNARLAFYSIGESIDLALLDSRVSGLMVAISGAIA